MHMTAALTSWLTSAVYWTMHLHKSTFTLLSGLVWGLAATQPSVYILQLSWANSRNDYAMMIEISWYYYYEFILQTQIMVAIVSASSLMNPT